MALPRCGGEVLAPAFSWSAGGFPVIASGVAAPSNSEANCGRRASRRMDAPPPPVQDPVAASTSRRGTSQTWARWR